MRFANSDIPVDRALIQKLAGPLAKLMTEQGKTPISEKELMAIMLDPKTEVEFPGINIRQNQDGVVVVRVVRTVVVSTQRGGNEFVTLMEDGAK